MENPKLMIIHNSLLTEKLLKKTCAEIKIPFNRLYVFFSCSPEIDLDEILEKQPKVVITMGKEVCEGFFGKIKKMTDIISTPYINNLAYYYKIKQDFGFAIIPTYDANYIVNNGQKELDSLKESFEIARKIIFPKKEEEN